jgi:hypothetical protein
MAEQICPVCGCHIAGSGYESEGMVYCCEPCASSSPCECGCCTVHEEPEDKN